MSDLPVHCTSHVAQTIGGPFHPVLGFGGGLVSSDGQHARRMLGEELWAFQGGERRSWEVLRGEDFETICRENGEPTGARSILLHSSLFTFVISQLDTFPLSRS